MATGRNNIIWYIAMLFIAFCLASTSLSIINNALVFYGMAFVSIILIELKINSSSSHSYKIKVQCYILFLFSLFFTNVINQVFDYRFFLFMAILLMTAPWKASLRLFYFKRQLVISICTIFTIITLVCLLCYFIGFNGPIMSDVDYNPLDFRGITIHPMWLAPICGITNIFLLMNAYKRNKKWEKLLLIVILGMSIYLSVVAASRSSLLASGVAMIFVMYMKAKNTARFIKIALLVGIVTFISIPYMDTERMEGKMETQQESGATSRDGLWNQRFEEIESSPIFGVGFATSGIGNKKETGRMESGSGWLSVASQTGIAGLFCMLIMLSKATMKKKWLKSDDELLFIVSLFLFLCIHSFFEGYIYTPGYNLCFLFWLLLGILIEYKTIKNRGYEISEAF